MRGFAAAICGGGALVSAAQSCHHSALLVLAFVLQMACAGFSFWEGMDAQKEEKIQ